MYHHMFYNIIFAFLSIKLAGEGLNVYLHDTYHENMLKTHKTPNNIQMMIFYQKSTLFFFSI